MEAIGDRIRAAREAQGLTQKGLAEAVGVSPPTISMWESGEIRSLSAENLLRLAEKIHRPPEWIVYGRERKPPEQKPVTPALIATVEALGEEAQASLLSFLRVMKGE